MKKQNHFPAVLLIIMVALITMPIVITLLGLGNADAEIWQHMVKHQLPVMIGNTVILIISVACLTAAIGTSLAWWVSVYEFRGRYWIEWVLVLPLAVPVYVMAFSQLGLFDYTGPIQTVLRDALGYPVQKWFPIHGTAGVIWVMSLAFYPYVYLLARNAFKSMGRRSIEVGQSLGYSPIQSFWYIALPMARPWIMGGVALVIMETLADFGAVSIFNFDTLTSGIYKVWFSFFSLPTAQHLAAMLLLVVLVVLLGERYWRGRRQYGRVGYVPHQNRERVYGLHQWMIVSISILILLFSFILPVGQLIFWAWIAWYEGIDLAFWVYAKGSLFLASMACLYVVSAAMILSLLKRYQGSNHLTNGSIVLSTIGYAVPGTILAVGIFIPVAWLDNQLIELFGLKGQVSAIFKGSLWVMMWAYTVRFLAVGFSAVDASMLRVTLSQQQAAQSLGVSGVRLIQKVFAPLMRGGILTALFMVFIDVMKEMPITLMTRPLGWDTLSVRIFSLTTEGLWREAALPALVLIIIGLWPVIYLTRQK